MEQKRIANVLKIFTIAVAVVGAIFFLWLVPEIIKECANAIQGAEILCWSGTIGMWVIGVLCYIALWEFWRICTRIGRDNSFCTENARSMRNIGILAFLAAILIIGGCVYLTCVNCFFGFQAIVAFWVLFIACGVGIICMALSGLIQNAARLKEENDLTI